MGGKSVLKLSESFIGVDFFFFKAIGKVNVDYLIKVFTWFLHYKVIIFPFAIIK